MQRTNHLQGIIRFTQRHLLTCLLILFSTLALLLGAEMGNSVWAHSPATSPATDAMPLLQEQEKEPTGLIPLPQGAKEDNPIALAAYTADLYYTSQGDPNAVRVVVRVRLINTSREKKASITLNLTGRTNEGTPIAPLLATTGTDPAQATVYPYPSLSRTLSPDERVWITFVYTDTLPQRPWIAYRYDVHRLQSWPREVGSVRITAHITPSLPSDALLLSIPHFTRFNGRILEWQWEGKTPSTPIRILFLRPDVAQRIHELRTRSQAGDAEATYALAQELTDWLTSAPSPNPVWQTFYPEALALWSRWAREHPDDPEPWRQMARLYWARARLSDNPEAYEGLLLDALENAWQRGARDATIRVQLAKTTRARIDRLRREKRWKEALNQLSRLADILGPAGEREIQHIREQIALDWARERMKAGDIAGMQEALRVGWGEAVLSYFRPHLPGIRYARVDVSTEEQVRRVVIHVLLEPNTSPSAIDAWDTWVTAARAALPEGTVEEQRIGERATFTATLAFTTPDELKELQHRLVDAMPDLPEWAPLQDALTPRHIVYRRTHRWWGNEIRWEEELSLISARQQVDNVLSTLQVGAFTPLPPDVPPELVQVRELLRQQDVKAWQELRDAFRAVYTLRWTKGWGPPTGARAVLQLGEEGILRAHRKTYDYPRLSLFALGLLLAWTGFTLFLWYKGT